MSSSGVLLNGGNTHSAVLGDVCGESHFFPFLVAIQGILF